MSDGVIAKIDANPASAIVRDKLKEVLNKIGEHSIEVKKTSLHITHGRAFLGVHPKPGGLLLNIVTDEPIVSERITKVEQVSKNRFHNEILITDPVQLNEEAAGWIKKAYQLTSI